MVDLQRRLRNRVQLTTDGHKVYFEAVEQAFGGDVDYAQMIKQYGNTESGDSAHRRYSPGQCNGVERIVVQGAPNLDLISTSYAERGNLTIRMSMRRFTRLTNAFSKKLENHAASFAMWSLWYNFGRVHQAAMAAGLARQRWTPRDVIDMISTSYAERGNLTIRMSRTTPTHYRARSHLGHSPSIHQAQTAAMGGRVGISGYTV